MVNFAVHPSIHLLFFFFLLCCHVTASLLSGILKVTLGGKMKQTFSFSVFYCGCDWTVSVTGPAVKRVNRRYCYRLLSWTPIPAFHSAPSIGRSIVLFLQSSASPEHFGFIQECRSNEPVYCSLWRSNIMLPAVSLITALHIPSFHKMFQFVETNVSFYFVRFLLSSLVSVLEARSASALRFLSRPQRLC